MSHLRQKSMLLTTTTYLLPHLAFIAQHKVKWPLKLWILTQINFGCCKLRLDQVICSEDDKMCVCVCMYRSEIKFYYLDMKENPQHLLSLSIKVRSKQINFNKAQCLYIEIHEYIG